MADDIHEFEKLLKQIIKSIKGLEESINESPMKGFEEIVKIRENFYRIGELNRKDSIFEKKQDMDDFIALLGKFLKFSSNLIQGEDSHVKSLLSNEEVREVVTELQKRHHSLTGN